VFVRLRAARKPDPSLNSRDDTRSQQIWQRSIIAYWDREEIAMKDNRVRETPTRLAVRSIVGPAAIWMVNQLLNQPRARHVRKAIDDAVLAKAQRAAGVVLRRSRNSMRNPGYLAAGLASVAIGISLIARSTRK
jgi:hypothetical protein